MHLLIYIDIALFIFIAFFIGYDLFFTLASFFRRRHRKHRSIRLQKFAVIFAAYKEDQVIQESVERILLQDYPADKYRVIVVSDHMREETNQALAKLPIELLTPDFKHSMKHKSITYALEYLKEGIDKVVILDADNLTDTDFLTRVNDITQDNIALQAHRTLKNDNTPIAVWDGISEEINNTIFRKRTRSWRSISPRKISLSITPRTSSCTTRRPHAKRSWHGKDPAGSTPNCWHSL